MVYICPIIICFEDFIFGERSARDQGTCSLISHIFVLHADETRAHEIIVYGKIQGYSDSGLWTSETVASLGEKICSSGL